MGVNLPILGAGNDGLPSHRPRAASTMPIPRSRCSRRPVHCSPALPALLTATRATRRHAAAVTASSAGSVSATIIGRSAHLQAISTAASGSVPLALRPEPMIGASILYDGGDARATRALPGASSVTGRYGLHSWATDLSVGYALAMANDWTLKVCEQSEPCVTGTEVIDRRRKPASLIGVDNPPDVSHLAHPLVFGKLEHQSLRIEADTMSCRQRRPDTSVGS